MKFIFISMTWWIRWTVVIGLLETRENCTNLKVTVWFVVGKATAIGLYSFEDNIGNAVTVNSKCDIAMISNFFMLELWRKRMPIRCLWFQQNGVTAHTATASLDVFRHLPHLLTFLGSSSPWSRSSMVLSWKNGWKMSYCISPAIEFPLLKVKIMWSGVSALALVRLHFLVSNINKSASCIKSHMNASLVVTIVGQFVLKGHPQRLHGRNF